MTAVVLDALAILCLVQQEPGAERIESRLADAQVSTVNVCEVLGKFADAGLSPAESWAAIADLGLQIHPFTPDDARQAAALRLSTKALGLSLGDRACIALAQRLGCEAMTTDRAWSSVAAGVVLTVVR